MLTVAPQLIILVRHAQSVGNANRNIHQTVPDHRVPLTAHGRAQALAAGDKLASLLLPTDTLQIITSPYTRTRETTQGILSSSLQHHPNAGSIKVYEEPRIREQDFGNFQPCQAEMTRMWHERAAYGHFFYRIPNGESAADAYDRISGFNESLWRMFAEDDFPSVLVLVTHGLMTRVFLMKWYHYSVEYFEDLRNVDHCEFVIMKRAASGRYLLQSELRTWSGIAHDAEELHYKCPPVIKNASEYERRATGQPVWYGRKFGGCVGGCTHSDEYLDGLDDHKAHVMKAGRDFGGSRSGAASQNVSDNSESEDDADLDVAGPETPNEAATSDAHPVGGAEFMKKLQTEAEDRKSVV